LGERVVTQYSMAPEVVYGQDAVTRLAQLKRRPASIISDSNTADPGFVNKVGEGLPQAGMWSGMFHRVELDPSLQTARIDSEP